MDDIRDDLKEIKGTLVELVKADAVHNEILRTHEARSLALQSQIEKIATEIEPVKQHVSLMSRVLQGFGLILVGALTQAVIRYFF